MQPLLNLTVQYVETSSYAGGASFEFHGIDFIQQGSSQKFIFVPANMDENLIVFGTMINPYGHSLTSLITPFEGPVWSLLLMTILSLTVYFHRDVFVCRRNTTIRSKKSDRNGKEKGIMGDYC